MIYLGLISRYRVNTVKENSSRISFFIENFAEVAKFENIMVILKSTGRKVLVLCTCSI